MKKIYIVLCLASLVSFKAPAVSISARLNGQQAHQAKSFDKAGQTVVACLFNEVPSAAQDVLTQAKPDVKNLIKLQIDTMGLDKKQLSAVKLMVQDAAPLVLELIKVGGPLVGKHGKSVITIYKKRLTYLITRGDNVDMNTLDSFDREADEAILNLVADDANMDSFMDKLAAFNEKWAEEFALMMENAPACTVDREAMAEHMQESLQNILAVAISHKRAPHIQASVLPLFSTIKTQADVLGLVLACLNEVETKLPQTVGSIATFADFAVPYLVSVITESIDETLQSMPA
jgi:hypothetical protein